MKQRDNTIDILRGLAIFTMVAANMSADNYADPHPYWFRIFGSFAAPTFVFLAGLMVSYTSFHKAHPFGYYLKRGIAIICIAAFIDMLLWGAVPFSTFDVLYIIGLSLPIGKLFYSLHKVAQFSIIAILFVLTPILQSKFGYIEAPVEPELKLFMAQGFQGAIVWKQFLVDGWFPLFPWLGVSMLGMLVGKYRCETEIKKANATYSILGLLVFVSGLVSWIIINPTLMEREGYSELFYPPTLMFFMAFLGGIILLLGTIYSVRENKILKVLCVFGRSSLLMYILHTTFDVFVFQKFFGKQTLLPFAGLYFCHLIVLWTIAYSVQKITKGKKLPFILTLILGG
jgi:uncharacterized membrane protein